MKEAGDRGLSAIGLSPTEAVRAMWDVAAQRGERLAELQDVLFGRPAGNGDGRGRSSLLQEGRRLVPDCIASLGIPQAASGATDEELLEDALAERYLEA